MNPLAEGERCGGVTAFEHPLVEDEQSRRRHNELFGRFQLRQCRLPCERARDQLAIQRGKLSAVAQVGRGEAIDELERRLIGDEMARQLRREEACGRRVHRELMQDLAQRVGAFGVALAENRLATGLVPRRIEGQCGTVDQGFDAPAGQHGGERGDVGLRVATMDSQGMQLEDLAREVLVQSCEPRAFLHLLCAPRGPRDGTRVRACGQVVVEIAQHRRMRRRSDQQLLERAGDVRPDGLALERADEPAHAALGERDGEVIGPEQLQPFGERAACRRRGQQPRPCIGNRHLAIVAGEDLLGGHAGRRIARESALLGLGLDVGQRLRRAQQAGAAWLIGRADLRDQPGLRIGLRDIERRFAQAEAVHCDGSMGGGRCHGESPDSA